MAWTQQQKIRVILGVFLIVVLGGLVYWLNMPSNKVEAVGPAPAVPVKADAPKADSSTPPKSTSTAPTTSTERTQGSGGRKNPDSK